MARNDSRRGRKRRAEPTEGGSRKSRRWFNALLAVALLYVLSLNVSAAVERSERQAQLETATIEARALYDAFARFHEKNGRFPDSWQEPKFRPDTLAPLTTRGYYRGPITATLVAGQVDAYESPDVNGDEFWLEMTLEADPTVRLLVVRSDDAPLGGGVWREGVFVHRRGKLEEL